MKSKDLKAESAMWNALHDGCITSIQRSSKDHLVLTVEIDYLSQLVSTETKYFLIKLLHCESFIFQRWDEQTILHNEAVMGAGEIEMLSCKINGQILEIICENGTLSMNYRYSEISDNLDQSFTIHDVLTLSSQYWKQFGLK